MVHVYFIRCESCDDGPIKIGISADIEKRMLDMQVSNPYKLSLMFSIPVETRCQAQMVERRLHKYFKFARMQGEWFEGDINLNKFLKEYQTVSVENDIDNLDMGNELQHFASI